MIHDPLALAGAFWTGPVESEAEGTAMDQDPRRSGTASKAAKATKKLAKKATMRDVPHLPTARQIEQSINRGTSVPLTEFVKGVKL